MKGLAQRQFIEKHERQPWSTVVQTRASITPFLEELVTIGAIGYVDLAIAEKAMREGVITDPSEAALLCHLSNASRNGHLCITVTEGRVTPPAAELCQRDDHYPSLNQYLPAEGHLDLESDAAMTLHQIARYEAMIVEGAGRTSAKMPMVRHGNNCYLERHWALERNFIDGIIPLLSETTPTMTLDMSQINASVAKILESKKLLPEQAQAVIRGCESPFSLVTGGPGTGKTYTAGILLRTLWEGMDIQMRERCKFVLAAPTGKAASQLEGSIRRALEGVQGFPLLKGQTLHTLLGVGRRQISARRVISADVVLVDESSMIDLEMMSLLIHSLRPGARLILLGDRFQLPPVESGAPFADLVELMHKETFSQGKERITELTKCLRAELRAIIDTADAVKCGDGERLLALLESSGVPRFDENIDFKEIQKRLLKEFLPRYPMISSLPDDPATLLAEFNHFRILSPLRQGPLGVDSLNAMFHQACLSRSCGNDLMITPIMIAANNPRLELFNGEVGLLVTSKSGSQGNFALFESKESGGALRKIAALMLPKYEYAYCISVHKSQGSEFDHVVMLLPEGAERFGCEALYTGITRARSRLEVWSKKSTLLRTLERRSLRNSGISSLSELQGCNRDPGGVQCN